MRARLILGLLVLILTGAPDAAVGQGTSGHGLHRLSWPGKDWSLDVSLQNINVSLEDFLGGDLGFWLLATLETDDKSKRRPVMFRIQLASAKVKGSDTDFRDFAVKKLKKASGVIDSSIKTLEHKQIPVVRYSVEHVLVAIHTPHPTQIGPLMRNLDAFFVKDDVWITFSLLAPSLSKETEALFYAVLDSVKFTDTSNPSSSFDYFYKGKFAIHQKQYKQAAEYLNTALNLELKQRQLDDEHWRNLIGHLVDIYTATGDKTRIEELLDYAVKHDPTFPLFHLALAQHYASHGDLDATLAALEKAYLHRKNDKSYARWTDPMSHPAYEPFKKNEKFRKAVKAMKK
jgi:tetratricopeptide (TPR) repeat protein